MSGPLELGPPQWVDPRTICVALPSYNSQFDVLTVMGLCNLIGTGRVANQPLFMVGGSNVGAVRNSIAARFLESPLEWLVMIDADIGFRVNDWDLLWEATGHLAVCAEYLKKLDGKMEPATLGLGFARVHRSVFERLTELTGDSGAPALGQGIYCGKLMWDFFPQGVNPAGEYRQEDHGFWSWVKYAGFDVRLEQRTNLAHSGHSIWYYPPVASGDDPGV